MKPEDDSDSDIAATPRPERQPQTGGQRRSTLDDAYGETGRQPRLRTPIGRDFLDDDLPPLADYTPRPRMRETNRDLDRDLDSLTQESTAKQPVSERPRDVGVERRVRGDAAPAARASDRHAERPTRAPAPPPESPAEPKRSGSLIAFASVALLAVCGGGAWYWMQSNAPGDKPATTAAPSAPVSASSAPVSASAPSAPASAPSASAPSAPASAPSEPVGEPIRNAFYDQVQKAGMLSCSRVFPGLGHISTIGSSYSLQASWNKDAPADHGILAVTGMSFNRPDLKTTGAAVVFAAPVPGGCEGAAVRVITLPTSCATVAESQLPPNTTRTDDLSGVPLYELANGGGKLMLLPATENACAIVTIALGEN